MKTAEQIDEARSVLCGHIANCELSLIQKSLLTGMFNALVWAADGRDSSTMDRLLSGEPIVTPPTESE